jgi:tetratricopeptide (TPR) repeat protein
MLKRNSTGIKLPDVLASYLIVLSVAVLASGAVSAADNDWPDCNSNDVQLTIAGCTNVINADAGDTGKFPLDRAYVRRGNAYGKSRKFDLAIADFTKAIELNPKRFENYAARAVAYRETNRMPEALADFNHAISLNASDPRLLSDRGVIYKRTGKLENAIADFSKAIELDPKSILAYMNRSGAYRQQREFSKALADCHAADKLLPDPSNAIEMEASIVAATCTKDLKAFETGGAAPSAAPDPQNAGKRKKNGAI